ncbi:DUF2071 domain-containing protein [Nonomuraea rhodomycinica]|uniref:DUF2071 domain-containing protein n=2 Tax=Nonomuraea rhodomycinica TaxID=1712872 RepID=A0A7Y6MBP7_9ACTN|nr:DUF2071 domain-containing protein [Nonomuraea rhodomycinica]
MAQRDDSTRHKAPSSPRVAWPVMYQRWSQITFLHWRYPVEAVRALVPESLTVETFDGTAWVGLTPFRMDDVRTPGLPVLPWLSSFPETNCRTYVRDERGRPGIWFLSLDAGRLAAAVGGRAGYWLPYFWSDMSVRTEGDRRRYRCRRRWPGPDGVRCDVDVRMGPALAEDEQDELAHFLTARYRLFSVVAGRPAAAEVEHPDWPLRHARLTGLDQNVLQAAGLPAPDGDPVLHASPGVPVRVGMWSW